MHKQEVGTGLGFVAFQATMIPIFAIARLLRMDRLAIWWVEWGREIFPAFDVNLSVDLSRYFEMRGAGVRAEEVLTDAIRRNPDDGFLHAMLGLALQRSGEKERAIGHLEAAIEMGMGASERYERAVLQKLNQLRSK